MFLGSVFLGLILGLIYFAFIVLVARISTEVTLSIFAIRSSCNSRRNVPDVSMPHPEPAYPQEPAYPYPEKAYPEPDDQI